MTKKLTLHDRLDSLIPKTAKSASAVSVAPPSKQKKAEAESEPDVTNMEGDTESKSKNVDDQTQPNEEGSHAKTNDKDVKDLGVEPLDKTAMDKIRAKFGAGKDNMSQKKAGEGGMDHTAAHNSIALTGEDPKNELSGVLNNKKEDPGSTTPLRVDNDELDGKKYASMSLPELYPIFNKSAGELMLDLNDMLADVEVAPAAKTAGAEGDKTAATPAATPATKTAGEQEAHDTLYTFIKSGAHRAQLVGTDIMKKRAAAAAQKKQAEDAAQKAGAAAAAQPKSQPASRKVADGPPPMGGGDMGGMGGGMGGGAPPPPAPGPDGGGAPGGAPGGQPSDEDIIAMLKAEGMTDEQIAQLLAQAEGDVGGGAGGGAPPPPGGDAGAGAPPPDAAPKAASDKIAADNIAKIKKLTPKAAAHLAAEIIRRSLV